jgi:hypothetical protein
MCVLPRFTTWVASFVLAVTFCHTAGADQTAAGAGPAQWADDLTAIDAQDWSYDRAAHLLERAGFGGTPAQIQRLAQMTPQQAVAFLVRFQGADTQPSAGIR